MRNSEEKGTGFLPFTGLHVFLTLYLITLETIMFSVSKPISEPPMGIRTSEYFTFLMLYSHFLFVGLYLINFLVIWIRKKRVSKVHKGIYYTVAGILFSTLYIVITQPILHEHKHWGIYVFIPLTAFVIFAITYEKFLVKKYFSEDN
ncbi:hypothetical protein [Paenibacillus sp. NPDC058071]|uniref:hypothetical protein n=1 Tax=Paenibacillus sp. NPDC058071 TaxID=3346326 RepID=UPI0036DC0447